MTIDEVTSLLRIISDFTDEEIDRYYPIAEMYFNQYRDIEITNGNRERVLYLIASRIYYEISKLRIKSEISSFKAGDVTVTSSDNELKKAEGIYKSALENAGDLIEDTGFVFKGV